MISLIDVISSVDAEGKPIGHGLKALRDLKRVISKPVQILAGREYLDTLGIKECALPYSRKTGEERHIGAKVLINYLYSLFMSKGSTLVYIITNEPLLWAIALFKGKRNIIIVTYENWNIYIKNNLQHKLIRQFLVKRGLSRVDGYIVTNRTYVPDGKFVRVPDYYCTDEIEELGRREKVFGCACLGEMRYGKDVCGLAKILGKTDIPLLIAGSFQSKQLYYATMRYQSKNIKIVNQNLSYDDYMMYLASYKYVVLPYDAKCYDGRTSGVLLESIFVGAIPIAPKALLHQNGISGLGYTRLSEIEELIRAYENGEIVVSNNLNQFRYEYVRRKIQHFIQKINL